MNGVRNHFSPRSSTSPTLLSDFDVKYMYSTHATPTSLSSRDINMQTVLFWMCPQTTKAFAAIHTACRTHTTMIQVHAWLSHQPTLSPARPCCRVHNRLPGRRRSTARRSGPTPGGGRQLPFHPYDPKHVDYVQMPCTQGLWGHPRASSQIFPAGRVRLNRGAGARRRARKVQTKHSTLTRAPLETETNRDGLQVLGQPQLHAVPSGRPQKHSTKAAFGSLREQEHCNGAARSMSFLHVD